MEEQGRKEQAVELRKETDEVEAQVENGEESDAIMENVKVQRG